MLPNMPISSIVSTKIPITVETSEITEKCRDSGQCQRKTENQFKRIIVHIQFHIHIYVIEEVINPSNFTTDSMGPFVSDLWHKRLELHEKLVSWHSIL